MVWIFEPKNTVQFTIVTSVAPNSAPALTIHGIASAAVVNGLTSAVSDTTHHYAMVTMPDSEGYYVGSWYMTKTVVSSEYDFYKRFSFRISETERDEEP
jgi:hypothetical protein